MGELMMVEKESPALEGVDLPIFYMNDFSVLGLVVHKLAPALEALQADGYHVVRKKGNCARIRFNDLPEFNKLFETLSQNHIDYSTADLVTQAYQG